MKPFFCCPEYNVIGIKYFAKYLMKQGQRIISAGPIYSGPGQLRSTMVHYTVVLINTEAPLTLAIVTPMVELSTEQQHYRYGGQWGAPTAYAPRPVILIIAQCW